MPEDSELQALQGAQSAQASSSAAEMTRANPMDEIDLDELSVYILNLLKNDIRDREEFGWTDMRTYDQLAYDGYKKKATEPWANASNYAVCLTSTLLDTGHANVMGGIFADRKQVVKVEGVGPEDMRTQKLIESLLNWQVINSIDDAYDVIDRTVKRAFKHGNGCVKVIKGHAGAGQKDRVIWVGVPIENIFLPVDARSAQPSGTDHIFELIHLTENDKRLRETMKGPDGKLIYDGIKDLQKGGRIQWSTAIDQLVQIRDTTSGTSLGRRYTDDLYYLLECYLTYWYKPKNKPESEWKSAELIVTLAPNGGKVFRASVNPFFDEDEGEHVRPYSLKWVPYPREDRIYGDSLPWIIKQTQEELDYAHNQTMNAAEELLKPPKFYDPASGFDPETTEAVPNGWYPIPDPGRNLYIPTFNFNPIFERQFERYWEYAQRRTGFTELFQGRVPDKRSTLGEAELRVNKTEIRFKTIYDRFEQGWDELIYLTYFYDRKFMPKETVIKVLGTAEYKTVGELFPEGIKGKYNFYFSSSPMIEKARRRADFREFYKVAVSTPMVAASPGNQWKLLMGLAESMGIKNLDEMVTRPREANVLSAQEAIQRIMSGQMDVTPEPTIDAPEYLLRIQAFMKTDAFAASSDKEKQAMILLLRRAEAIRKGQIMAMHDAMILREGAAEARGGQNGTKMPAPSAVPVGAGAA